MKSPSRRRTARSVPPAAAVSNSRTEVVPTAATRPPAVGQREYSRWLRPDHSPLGVELVFGERRGGDRPRMCPRPTCSVIRPALCLVPPAPEQGAAKEVEPRRGAATAPGFLA